MDGGGTLSVEAITLVLHHSPAKGTDKLVLLGIANHAGDGGAWPAVETLARYANVHERNVQRSIDRLIATGQLVRHLQRGGTLDSHASDWLRPNRYDVVVTCPPSCDGTANHRPRRNPQAVHEVVHTPGMSESDRVAQTPPGGAGATPPGGADATLTVHRTRPTHAVPASTTDRARDDDAELSLSTADARKRARAAILNAQHDSKAARPARRRARRTSTESE